MEKETGKFVSGQLEKDTDALQPSPWAQRKRKCSAEYLTNWNFFYLDEKHTNIWEKFL